jgi:hypothetical protein
MTTRIICERDLTEGVPCDRKVLYTMPTRWTKAFRTGGHIREPNVPEEVCKCEENE